MKQNYIKEVEARIAELNTKKQTDMNKAIAARQAAEIAAKEAEAAMTDATDKLELERFAEAKKKKEEAETARAMYEGKCQQLEQQAFVSDEDSEAVVNGILAYEEQLAGEYMAAIKKPLEELQTVQKDYMEKVTEAERVLRRWTTEIHANYISGMRIQNKETGEWSNRSETPVPVRMTPYLGCTASRVVWDFLTSDRLRRVYGTNHE